MKEKEKEQSANLSYRTCFLLYCIAQYSIECIPTDIENHKPLISCKGKNKTILSHGYLENKCSVHSLSLASSCSGSLVSVSQNGLVTIA